MSTVPWFRRVFRQIPATLNDELYTLRLDPGRQVRGHPGLIRGRHPKIKIEPVHGVYRALDDHAHLIALVAMTLARGYFRRRRK